MLVPRASELDARPTYRCRRSCHRHLSQIVEEAIRKTITALTFRRSRVFLRIRVEVTSGWEKIVGLFFFFFSNQVKLGVNNLTNNGIHLQYDYFEYVKGNFL